MAPEHQIDIAGPAGCPGLSDNLTRETTDPWAAEIVSETGPEAEGKAGVGAARARRYRAPRHSRDRHIDQGGQRGRGVEISRAP